MGKYINVNSKGNSIGSSYQEKIDSLLLDKGILINEPETFRDGLVCVVNNGIFAAVGYAYDETVGSI